MILKTITALALRLVRRTDAPERPHYLIRPPCQSELKRTLRRGDTPANTVHRRGFDAPRDAHSTRMVNDRFRATSIYGFEMVDARARTNFHAIVAHQSKIYAESNHSNFGKIFGRFTSIETLRIY
jgi:hypothetical protein